MSVAPFYVMPPDKAAAIKMLLYLLTAGWCKVGYSTPMNVNLFKTPPFTNPPTVGGNSYLHARIMKMSTVKYGTQDEEHPWGRFPVCNNIKTNSSVILGSFPPSKFTIHPNKLSAADMHFFYGSKENSFWQLFCEIKGIEATLPADIEILKTWIKKNNWIVSDIVKTTRRKKDSALDNDLIPIEWNLAVVKDIFENNEVDKLFFTSQWVKQHFDRHLRSFLKINSNVHEIILLSPSKNGLRAAKRAKFTNLEPGVNESAAAYRHRYYKHVLQ